MVEPPGTAPGSDPLIPCAFIAIVRSKPRTGLDIDRSVAAFNGWEDGTRVFCQKPKTLSDGWLGKSQRLAA